MIFASLFPALEAVAFALGGQAGQRLALKLHMPVSGDTLLRLIRRTTTPAHDAPMVLGVDDWAKQQGRVYGTILVDLERHQAVDLLPDRTAETLAQWLGAHPSITTVARDRSGEYARGITLGAPQAQQVADRWHLLVNLRDALEKLLDRLRPELTVQRYAKMPEKPGKIRVWRLPVIASDHSAMTELTQAGWLAPGDRWWDALQSSFAIVPSIGGIIEALEAAYDARGGEKLRAAAVEFAHEYDADLVAERYWVPALEALAGPREVPPFNGKVSRQVRRAQERKAAKATS